MATCRHSGNGTVVSGAPRQSCPQLILRSLAAIALSATEQYRIHDRLLLELGRFRTATGTTKPSSTVGDTSNFFCIDTNHVAPITMYYTDLQKERFPASPLLKPGRASMTNTLVGRVGPGWTIGAREDRERLDAQPGMEELRLLLRL